MKSLWLLLFILATEAAAVRQPPFYGNKSDLLYYLDAHGTRHRVRSKKDWNRRRTDVIGNMELVMGPLPPIDHHLDLAIQVLKEVHTAKYTWRRLTYAAERGDRAYAYLYLPNGLGRHRSPGIISLHGSHYARYVPRSEATPQTFPGTDDFQYAQELAERGYVVIAPDYPYLGPDYKTSPYALGYVSTTMKAIVNHIRAVDVLESLPQVDRRRIAAVGLSLGGHNSLFLAAFEPRVRVIVSSAGFNAFAKYMGGNLQGWSGENYMPRVASEYGKRPDRMPFDFSEVLAAMAPRPVFVNAPLDDKNYEVSGVRDCVTAALPVYEKVFHASDRLVAQYPPGAHGFSPEARAAAYAFLDRWLK